MNRLHRDDRESDAKLHRRQYRRGNSDAAYVCPMHPEIKSDRPGVCPKCGMNLVPAEK
ncbi:MAG: heavy metal-binding domain-containing protein, partial [Patescibacteria group bacterium]